MHALATFCHRFRTLLQLENQLNARHVHEKVSDFLSHAPMNYVKRICFYGLRVLLKEVTKRIWYLKKETSTKHSETFWRESRVDEVDVVLSTPPPPPPPTHTPITKTYTCQ